MRAVAGRAKAGFRSLAFSSSNIWDPLAMVTTAGPPAGGRCDRGDDVSALAHANVDWRETDHAHSFVLICLVIDLSADLKVQVEDNNMLEISGDRVERRRRSYRRRFRLPENADLEGIKCGLENGVLTVTIPKKVTRETSQKC